MIVVGLAIRMEYDGITEHLSSLVARFVQAPMLKAKAKNRSERAHSEAPLSISVVIKTWKTNENNGNQWNPFIVSVQQRTFT